MHVEVCGDNQLAVVGGGDLHKGRKLGENGWRGRRGDSQVKVEDSEWPSEGGTGETE